MVAELIDLNLFLVYDLHRKLICKIRKDFGAFRVTLETEHEGRDPVFSVDLDEFHFRDMALGILNVVTYGSTCPLHLLLPSGESIIVKDPVQLLYAIMCFVT
jgi:hypothetical protein